LLALAIPATLSAQLSPAPLGIFEDHRDIGTVLHPGAASFDRARDAYTVTGSGENMWFGVDDFHFVWKRVSGDVALSADIAFIGAKGNPHRKAVLMIRQSLDGQSAGVDIARHGEGLTSLQFREATGADTHEVESSVSAPARMRLEKRGDTFIAFVSGKDGKLQPAGAATQLKLTGDFYVGIGVSAHDKDATETAVFTKVKLETLPPAMDNKTILHSSLETISIASTDRRVVYTAPAHFEAPNWSRDGSYLLFNQDGLIYRLDANSDTPKHIDTGFAVKCNNDHGISPDGQTIAISDQSQNGHSLIYTLPIGGGIPTQITKNSPSYWHGWSPDGKTLAFTAQRGDNFDIYSIPATGGEETRLTTAPGLDDGPEYSPDGAWIYFNSERTGRMQIWRMKPDGSQQEQVVFSETNDWFPHLSPDGKWMVFVSYDKSVKGHPPNKDVELNLMSVADGKVRLLTKLFGGQGTINVHSWSPDSTKLAFVSYELLPDAAQE
jgi:Tol biopolymer transport system component